MIVDVEQAYTQFFGNGGQENILPKETRDVLLQNQFQANEDGRYKLDVAMWYAIIKKEPTAYYTPLIKNMFTLLHYGGVMYRKDKKNTWGVWADAQIPVAALPSHGGRVMVQLPRDGSIHKHDFWDWLWGGRLVVKRTRAASTHEVSHLSIHEVLPCNRKKQIKEEKLGVGKPKLTSFTGQYGVNIPMGGLGNINPFSGARITADGRFGHLFLYYKESSDTKNGAVLLGSEASGPGDQDALHVGTSDQYGGSHGLGGSTTYEAPGGKRWKDQAWHGRGPTGDYDFLFIDLSTGWDFLTTNVFDKAIIGRHGERPQVAVIDNLMSLQEWKSRRNVHGKPNALLTQLDTAVAQYHQSNSFDYKRICLLNIVSLCTQYIASKQGRKDGEHPRVRAAMALKSQAEAVLTTLPPSSHPMPTFVRHHF